LARSLAGHSATTATAAGLLLAALSGHAATAAAAAGHLLLAALTALSALTGSLLLIVLRQSTHLRIARARIVRMPRAPVKPDADERL